MKRLAEHRDNLLCDVDKCEEALSKGYDAMKIMAIEITELRALLAEKYESFVM